MKVFFAMVMVVGLVACCYSGTLAGAFVAATITIAAAQTLAEAVEEE